MFQDHGNSSDELKPGVLAFEVRVRVGTTVGVDILVKVARHQFGRLVSRKLALRDERPMRVDFLTKDAFE